MFFYFATGFHDRDQITAGQFIDALNRLEGIFLFDKSMLFCPEYLFRFFDFCSDPNDDPRACAGVLIRKEGVIIEILGDL